MTVRPARKNLRPPRQPRGNARDVALVAGIAVGDRNAFKALYLAYYDRLFRFLFRMTRCTSEVEELVNDVMFVVWQSAATFKGNARVSTWIFGIAYRKALKSLRSGRRHRTESLPATEFADSAPGPMANVSRHEIQDRLRGALDRLSPEHRTVVELAYGQGYSCREISDVVGCPVNTVKTRMHHARKHLGRLLPGLASALKPGHDD